MVQSSLVIWARYYRCVPCMSCMCPPVVVEPWLLLAHQWKGLILWLVGCEDWLVRRWPYRARFAYWSSGACLVFPVVYCSWMQSQVVLWLDLKPATGCARYRASWERPHHRPVSAAACALPRATWWESSSNLYVVTTTMGLEVSQKAKLQTEASHH